MEFPFEVNEILQQNITKITNSLIPPGFKGDRRKLCDTQTKLSSIINAMGEASALAQGLIKPITTAERLKNFDHRLYLLVAQNEQQGCSRVSGMLKMGQKGLYIFDRAGEHYHVHPVCVLDFYVHESVQRMGLGKRIFEHMLQEEGVQPVKLAIDRPSEKFLAFLKKHYGLNSPISQNNNFVVFDGFFPEKNELSPRGAVSPRRSVPMSYLSNNSHIPPITSENKSHDGYPVQYGRYAAPRPVCSIGQIIHSYNL